MEHSRKDGNQTTEQPGTSPSGFFFIYLATGNINAINSYVLEWQQRSSQPRTHKALTTCCYSIITTVHLAQIHRQIPRTELKKVKRLLQWNVSTNSDSESMLKVYIYKCSVDELTIDQRLAVCQFLLRGFYEPTVQDWCSLNMDLHGLSK